MDNKLNLQKDDPIAIIGAGPSGLGSAYYLKQKGYSNITIFEKRDRIAGMAYTEYIQEEDGKTRAYDMGAVLYDSDYPIVKDLLDNVLKLETMNVPPTTMTSPKGLIFEKMYNFVHNKYIWPLLAPKFSDELDTYFGIIAKNKEWLNSAEFPKNLSGENSDLTLPINAFLKKNGITHMQAFINVPVTCFGYGFLDEIPAIYALKYLNIRTLLTVLAGAVKAPVDENYYWVDMDTILPGIAISKLLTKNGFEPEKEKVFWFRRVANGMMSLMQKIADAGGANINLNTNVISIKRDIPGFPVQITYKKGSNLPETKQYKALIIAFPPIKTDLQSFMQLN
jgi:hypothetical protein